MSPSSKARSCPRAPKKHNRPPKILHNERLNSLNKCLHPAAASALLPMSCATRNVISWSWAGRQLLSPWCCSFGCNWPWRPVRRSTNSSTRMPTSPVTNALSRSLPTVRWRPVRWTYRCCRPSPGWKPRPSQSLLFLAPPVNNCLPVAVRPGLSCLPNSI